MASFCTKCGSALKEGSMFCTACGTPAAGTAAPPAVSTPPAAIQPQSGNTLKIILIIVAVLIGIGILSGTAIMFGVWRLSRAVKVTSPGHVSINTPMGNMTMGSASVSEADVGAPIYPNAKRDEGSLQISTGEGSMSTYVFKTPDPPAQVMAFYRSKLDPKSTFVETPDGGMITSGKDEGKDEKEGFMITVGRDGSNTAITIIRGKSKKAP